MNRLIFAACTAAILLHLSPSAAAADPVAEVGTIIAQCQAEQKDAKCAAHFWKFADLTGDGKLTVAEITRFFRLVVEHQSMESASQAPAATAPVDPLEAVAMTFLIGPLGAELVIDNFDYNGNHTIEREEIFADIDEGAFTQFVFDESKKLPERAGSLMLRAMQAGAAVRGP